MEKEQRAASDQQYAKQFEQFARQVEQLKSQGKLIHLLTKPNEIFSNIQPASSSIPAGEVKTLRGGGKGRKAQPEEKKSGWFSSFFSSPAPKKPERPTLEMSTTSVFDQE